MKRLNFKLALWLLGITLFSVVGVHFLHAYQIDRNADFLRLQAEEAKEKGDAREAVKQYNQYLKHRDDPAAYSVLAELMVEIASDSESTKQDRFRAYTILEEAIRRHEELDDVRRLLVDYTMKMGRFPEALEHIEYLVNHGAKGADLDYKRAKCYYYSREEEKALKALNALVGIDEATGQFKPDAPPGAEEPEAFELLAQIIYRQPDGPNRADTLMQQLVKWNDSAKAHLARAGYLQLRTGGLKPESEEYKALFDEAKKEIDSAYAKDANNADVLLATALFAMVEKDLTKADELLARALKEHPKRQDVYLRLSQLKLMQNDVPASAEQLKLGLKQASDTNIIMERLADIQFQLNDLEAVKETVKKMHDAGTFPIELLRYNDARIRYAEADFLAASKEFEAARPAFLRNSNSVYAQQLDVLLGHCYELLGQWDRELELYRGILQKYPDLLRPRLGEAVALQNLGRYDEAATSVGVLASGAGKIPAIRPQVMQLMMNEQLQKPEDQRDWSGVEEIAAMLYEEPGRSELEKTLLKADLLTVQSELGQAQELLTGACKEHPKEIRAWIALARLLARDKDNATKLTKLLNLAEEKVGDVPSIRLEKLRAVSRAGGEDTTAKLKELEKGLDKFPQAEQQALMLQFGAAYMQLRDYEDAKRCWMYAIEHDPKNGPTRQFMFELAFDNKDEKTMKQVVKNLRESPSFGPQSALYKYCAAASMIYPINDRKRLKPGPLTSEERTTLADARKMIDEALILRTEWNVLWRVKGEIEQLEGEAGGVARAITAYQRSMACSQTGQGTVARRLVQLLYATNRISEANDVLKFIGGAAETSDTWRRTIEDITFKSGDVKEAIQMAEKDIEKEPNSPASYVWYGQFLERAGRSDDAEAAYRKAVEVGPEMPQSWDLLVRRLVASKKSAEAAAEVHKAEKPLAKNPIGLARLYEAIGDFPHAESYYKAAIDEHPEDLLRIKQMVDFYFTSNQVVKAVPYLDQVIQKTAKSSDRQEIQHLQLARRLKAQILATPGDFDHIVAATKLIEQNAEDGKLGLEDTQAIVMMLAIRPEPESRAKATEMLENLQSRRPLSPRDQTILGQLYERGGKWEKGRDLMLNAVSRKSDDMEILFPFAQLLIKHGEYDDAARWVDRMEDMVNTSKVPVSSAMKQTVVVQRARLLVKSGQKDEAVKALETLLPRPLPQNQLRLLSDIAKLMEELELNDAAEKLLAEYVEQDPRGKAPMAAFVARHGDVAKSFQLLEEARSSEPVTALLPIAMDCIRRNAEEGTPERFKMLEGWARTAAEEEADPQQIKMLLAELYDLQGNSQAAIQIYREILADARVGDKQKALIKNNLSFILALTKGRPDSAAEAGRLIGESIRVFGPTADLIDTRAVVLLAQGKVQQAVADLIAATADSPSTSKYFHLAQAQKAANNLDAAKNAMAKAQELGGISSGQFGIAEQKLYKQLADELK